MFSPTDLEGHLEGAGRDWARAGHLNSCCERKNFFWHDQTLPH
jgi:hypothetical protein